MNARAEGRLRRKAEDDITYLCLTHHLDVKTMSWRQSWWEPDPETTNNRILESPDGLQGGDCPPFPSESWRPAKVCHGSHKQTLGKLTIFVFQSCRSSQTPLHAKTKCQHHGQDHITEARHGSLWSRHNHPHCLKLGFSVLGERGPPMGLSKCLNTQ